MSASQAEEFRRLCESPTREAWQLELERLLNGEREAAMAPLADAGEYVRKLLSVSKDPSRSSTELRMALEGLLVAWDPMAMAEPARLWYLLDLIATFPVPVGAAKLLRLFDHEEALSQRIAGCPGIDLRLKALEALSRYFDAPTTVHDAALERYVEILTVHLEEKEYATHACKVLLRLNRLDVSTVAIADLLRGDDLLSPIVEWAFETGARRKAVEVLSSAYAYCLDADPAMERRFRESIDGCGGRFESEGPRVAFPKAPQVLLPLLLNERSQLLYLGVYWNDTNENAPEILKSVVDAG